MYSNYIEIKHFNIPLNTMPNKGIVSTTHASTSTFQSVEAVANASSVIICLLYTSDAADE